MEGKVTVIVLAKLAQTNPERLARGIAIRFDPRLAAEDTQAKGQQTGLMVRNVLAGRAEVEGTLELRARIDEMRAAHRPIGAVEGLVPGGGPEEDGILSHSTYRVLGKNGSRLCRLHVSREGKTAWLELLPQ